MRHTYATAMRRAGVSLPALMKLLRHRTANMTLRYVEIPPSATSLSNFCNVD
jgi:integrase